MKFVPTPGYAGILHPSKAEAQASFLLAKYGIYACSDYLPVQLHDSEGVPFNAKSDFLHKPTGIRFEFKVDSVNATGSIRTSTSQLAASRSTSEVAKALKFGWNHSAAKLAACQEAMSEAGSALVVLFAKEPEQEVQDRLAKRGTFWLTIGSRGFNIFMLYLKLAGAGLAVGFNFFHPEDRNTVLHSFVAR